MTTRLLVVNDLAPTITLASLKKVFEVYGACMIELNSEIRCALVKYVDDDVYPKVKQYLDRSNLLGMNESIEANIQILDLPANVASGIQQAGQQNANSSVNKQQQEVAMEKNSQQKNTGNNFQAGNNMMNIDRNGRNSPFQPNNNNVNQNMSMNKFGNNYQQNQNMMMTDNNGLKNVTNNNMAMKERDGKASSSMIMDMSKPPQMNLIMPFGDHEYLRSQVNPSSKVSNLVEFYQKNKDSSTHSKVKAYSSYQEFALDMQTLPKVKETQNFAGPKYFPSNEGLRDIDTLTIAELTAELRKNGVNITGSKQVLKHALERVRNENWLQRGCVNHFEI